MLNAWRGYPFFYDTHYLSPLRRRIQPACVDFCSVLDESLVEANRAARAAAAARLPVQKQTKVSAYTMFVTYAFPHPVSSLLLSKGVCHRLNEAYMGSSAAKGCEGPCKLGSTIKVDLQGMRGEPVPHVYEVLKVQYIQAARFRSQSQESGMSNRSPLYFDCTSVNHGGQELFSTSQPCRGTQQ